jgi:hypothetical protein
MGKAWLKLPITNLMVSRPTLGTGAATTNERKRHPVTFTPPPDIFSDSFNHPGDFMPGYMRQFNIRIMAHPSMPIAPTQAGCHYLEDNTMFLRDWVRYVFDCRSFAKLIV